MPVLFYITFQTDPDDPLPISLTNLKSEAYTKLANYVHFDSYTYFLPEIQFPIWKYR